MTEKVWIPRKTIVTGPHGVVGTYVGFSWIEQPQLQTKRKSRGKAGGRRARRHAG